MSVFFAALGWGLFFSPFFTEADAIVGHWETPDAKSIVEIYLCGSSYCGKIVDLKEKIYPADDARGMGGRVKVDRENPEESLRERAIIGLVLMAGFRFNGSSWGGGTIYDPENGKTYKCRLTLSERDTLQVRGYVGISLFGRTSVWKRLPSP